MAKLKPGDRVAYSVQFLKSIGQSHAHMSHDRGVIIKIIHYGEHFARATIQWKGDSPERVNVKNLTLI